MIKIVYRDLSPGLHASAQVSGRHTVISLLPGLTPNQRRAALRRIRHNGRMGHGPRVPATGLALAVGRDRIKATTRTGAAVVRLHPAGSTLPVVLLSAAAAVFVLMATVSIHVLPGPKSSDQNPVLGGVTPGASSAPRISQSFAPSIMVPGHSTQPGHARNGLAARQPGSGGSAVSTGRSAEGTSGGETVFGSERGQTGTGTGLVTATSAGSGSGSGSGTGTGPSAGSGGTGRSGSSGSGSSGSGGSGSGSGSGTGATGGSGTGSGTTSGSGGTGPSGSGSGSGGSGSGGSGTGTGSGGTGSSGSGTSGTGGTGSGSGSSGGSSGGLCVNLLGVVQACLG